MSLTAEDCSETSQLSFSAPTRGQIETQLNALKENLLSRQMHSVTDRVVAQHLSRAANEAAALAWFTHCPMLVLPTLFEEKIAVALEWGEKQARLRRH